MKSYNSQGELKVRTTSPVVAFSPKAGINIESPTATEDAGFFYAKDALLVSQITAVVHGSTPSLDWTIRYDADRSAAGTELKVGGWTTTNTTTGHTITSFDNALVPAGSWLWLETTGKSGTVTKFEATIFTS